MPDRILNAETRSGKGLSYRRGVGIVLFNNLGHVFVAKRIDMTSEAWQMPQGGIDGTENPEEAARRELKEETGITSVRVLAHSKNWLKYDLPAELIPRLWNGQYCGQEQLWFAMRFEGPDSEINIATNDPEFTHWRWVALADVPGMIVPFKRDLYHQLVQEFGHLALPGGI